MKKHSTQTAPAHGQSSFCLLSKIYVARTHTHTPSQFVCKKVHFSNNSQYRPAFICYFYITRPHIVSPSRAFSIIFYRFLTFHQSYLFSVHPLYYVRACVRVCVIRLCSFYSFSYPCARFLSDAITPTSFCYHHSTRSMSVGRLVGSYSKVYNTWKPFTEVNTSTNYCNCLHRPNSFLSGWVCEKELNTRNRNTRNNMKMSSNEGSLLPNKKNDGIWVNIKRRLRHVQFICNVWIKALGSEGAAEACL